MHPTPSLRPILSKVLVGHTMAAPVAALLAGVVLPVSLAAAGGSPNILFIVYDDVGIDQMAIAPFNWTAEQESAPAMPVLEAIAQGGVAFTNFWAMPECSPSRACFFTGRWPNRTGVVDAIVDPMLPNVQLNPAEFTLPQLLNGVARAPRARRDVRSRAELRRGDV